MKRNKEGSRLVSRFAPCCSVALTLVNGVWQGTIVEGNFNANFTGTFTGTRR